MRRGGEFLDELKEFIQGLFRRVSVEEAPIGFAGEAGALALETPCESQALGGLAEDLPTRSLLHDLASEVATHTAGFDCRVDAENYEEALAATGSAAEPVLGGLAASAAIPIALPAEPETRVMAVPGASVETRGVGVPQMHASASAGRSEPFLSPPTYRATHRPARGRIFREDWRASEAPLVRRSPGGRMSGRLAITAMRALVSTTGLPPAALELIGVFDGVPTLEPRRLSVDSDGKRLRLWYPVGARATGVGRLAVARVRETGHVRAAVVPPG